MTPRYRYDRFPEFTRKLMRQKRNFILHKKISPAGSIVTFSTGDYGNSAIAFATAMAESYGIQENAVLNIR